MTIILLGRWVLYLDLPQCLGAGGGGGRLSQCGSEKDVLLLLVLISGQELLLLGVEQPHHVSLTRGRTRETICAKACKLHTDAHYWHRSELKAHQIFIVL